MAEWQKDKTKPPQLFQNRGMKKSHFEQNIEGVVTMSILIAGSLFTGGQQWKRGNQFWLGSSIGYLFSTVDHSSTNQQ